MPFKWHKFLVYFALWVTAILSGITGVSSLTTGADYLSWMPGRALLVILLGIAAIVQEILAAFAAVGLMRFKWAGVKRLKAVCIIALISSIISLFSEFSLLNVISVVVPGIMIWANSIYYKKRVAYFDTESGPRKCYIHEPETLLPDSDFCSDKEKVTFGSYFGEPIEWVVLEEKGDERLLLSVKGLEVKQYNEENTPVTWETCTLRRWLNGEFYNAAFSLEEKA